MLTGNLKNFNPLRTYLVVVGKVEVAGKSGSSDHNEVVVGGHFLLKAACGGSLWTLKLKYSTIAKKRTRRNCSVTARTGRAFYLGELRNGTGLRYWLNICERPAGTLEAAGGRVVERPKRGLSTLEAFKMF